jgi:hypothetical protein
MEPWFDPNRYAWIPGTTFAVVAVLLAVMVAWLVPRGQARRLILTAWVILWASALALVAVGLLALLRGQPWGVWYALVLPGVVGTAVIGGTLLVILKRYREIEQRRLSAKDLL